MLRDVATAIFGPSRASARWAAAAYLDELESDVGGEIVPREQIVQVYDERRVDRGWPRLPEKLLLAELSALGCPVVEGVKVPWRRPLPSLSGPAPATPPPVPIVVPQPKPQRQPVAVRKVGISRNEALLDLQARLRRGETIPSQDALRDAWGVNKATVSRWLAAWEGKGWIPYRQRDGRCNVIHLNREPRRVAC